MDNKEPSMVEEMEVDNLNSCYKCKCPNHYVKDCPFNW